MTDCINYPFKKENRDTGIIPTLGPHRHGTFGKAFIR